MVLIIILAFATPVLGIIVFIVGLVIGKGTGEPITMTKDPWYKDPLPTPPKDPFIETRKEDDNFELKDDYHRIMDAIWKK